MPAAKAAPAGRPLAGRSAIVTGSTSGIGLGIARALAGQGANIVLNGLGSGDALDELRAEVARTYDVKVLLDQTDQRF
jgi:3-hydroxybutyrate dehydrogenase